MLAKVNWKGFILPIIIGCLLWIVTPFRPAAITPIAWHLFALFIATIVACITKPLPMVGSTLVAVTLGTLLHIFNIKEVSASFGNTTVWLIAMCLFMSAGFIRSGLGKRVAYIFIKSFGKRTIGLAYSLSTVETLMAIAIPSNIARVNGIMYPIIDALSRQMGSDPKEGTQRKLGSYLIFNEYEVNIVTSTMFLTGLAGNMVALGIAKTQGITISWMQWFLAAIVPGIISLILVPFILYKIYPPEVKETPNANAWASKKLEEMGKMTPAEKIMSCVFVLALLLWLLGSTIGIDATLVGFIAVSILLISGVITVKDMMEQKGAWSLIVWLSIVMLMSQKLMKLGFFPWFSKQLGLMLHGVNWVWVLVILFLVYFYIHYMFPSITTQSSAVLAGFLSIALGAGVPKLMAGLMLGFAGSIFCSTTPYSAGPAALLSTTGYVKSSEWWKLSAILGIFLNVVWLGGGLLWTKIIGFW